jgi:hypothetical protein
MPYSCIKNTLLFELARVKKLVFIWLTEDSFSRDTKSTKLS